MPTMQANVKAIIRGRENTRIMRRANYLVPQYSADREWSARVRWRLRILQVQRTFPRAACPTSRSSGGVSAGRSRRSFVDHRAVCRGSAVGERRRPPFRCARDCRRATRGQKWLETPGIAHRCCSRSTLGRPRVSASGAKSFSSRSVLPRVGPSSRYRRRADRRANAGGAATRDVPTWPCDVR